MFWAAVSADIILFASILSAAFLIERSKSRLRSDQLSRLDRLVRYAALALFVPPMIYGYLERHGPAWVVLILSGLLLGLLSYFPPIVEARFRGVQRRQIHAEFPERPEPRGVKGWLRLGAIVAGALAAIFVAFSLGGPLDALTAAWGLPHWLSPGRLLSVAAMVIGTFYISREWRRPVRRFLAAHGLS